MADELANALFGDKTQAGGVTVMYGVALADSEDGEVLVQLDDEIVALGVYDEDEGFEVDLEDDEDSLDAIEDDALEAEPGEDDDPDGFDEDETNEDDDAEDATEETDEGEEV